MSEPSSLVGRIRQVVGVAAGDEVEVDLELDTEPRELTVSPDFADALDHDADARFGRPTRGIRGS